MLAGTGTGSECPVEIPEEEVEDAVETFVHDFQGTIVNFVLHYVAGALKRYMQLYGFMPSWQHRVEPLAEPSRVGFRMVFEVYLDDEQIEDLRRKVVREVCKRREETVRKARAARMVKELLGRGESYVRGAENTDPGEGREGAGGGGAEDGTPQGGHSAESASAGA
jgi:hypothetical protein